MSDKSTTDASAKQAKKGDKKGKKDKKDKKGSGSLSVSSHPRAAGAVRRAKGFGGLIGFGLAALLAHRAGLSVSETVERALLAGIAGYLIAWACAVTVWRQILVGQLRAAMSQRAAAAPARRTIAVPAPREPDAEAAAASGGE